MISSQVPQQELKSTQEQKVALGGNDVIKNNANPRANIEFIQQFFEKKWSSYTQERRFLESFADKSSDGNSLFIESIFEKLKSKQYKTVIDIQSEFKARRMAWDNACKERRLNKAFSEGYLLCLRIMEALFIDGYMHQLANAIKPVVHAEAELSEHTDVTYDLESIAKKMITQYDETLHEKMFSGEDYQDRARRILVRHIRNFNLSVTELADEQALIVDAKLTKLGDKNLSSVQDHIAAELEYSELSTKAFSLKARQDELMRSRDELLTTNKRLVETYTKQCTQYVTMPHIDVKATHDFDKKITALRELNECISLIEEQNYLSELLRGAKEYVKAIMVGNKEFPHGLREDLAAYNKFDHADKPAGLATFEILKAMFNIFTKLDFVKEGKNGVKPLLIDCPELKEKRDKINHELEDLYAKLNGIVEREMAKRDLDALRTRMINEEHDALMQMATRLKEVVGIPDEFLESYRVQLDVQWSKLLADKKNQESLKKEIQKMRLQAELSNGQDKTALQAITVLEEHLLKSQRLSVEPLKPVKPVSVATVPANVQHPEDIGEVKPTSPHWYDKFLDTPIKRSLCVGVISFLVVGLACTGLGLLVGMPLVTLLTVVLGGAGATFAVSTGISMLGAQCQNQGKTNNDAVAATVTNKTSTSAIPFKPNDKVSVESPERVAQNNSRFGSLFAGAATQKENTLHSVSVCAISNKPT